MIETHPEPVRLFRRDRARNMARFYTISLEPTLFGEAALVRNWGRIGSRGQVLMETFPQVATAVEAGAKIEQMKRRRGYAEFAKTNPSERALNRSIRRMSRGFTG